MEYAPKMQDLLRSNIITALDAISEATGKPRTHYVIAVGGHQSVWARIKKGRAPITTALYDRMMGGLSALWPDAAPWPESIPRPEPDIAAIRKPEALAPAAPGDTPEVTTREEQPHGA